MLLTLFIPRAVYGGYRSNTGKKDATEIPLLNDLLNNQDPLPWFAVRVRSNFERQVSMMLTGSGYETFLPAYAARRVWSDRAKEVSVPLFPGYTFCRIDPEKRLPLLKTPGVVNLVGIGRVPQAVPDDEIAAVRFLVNSRLPITPWPFLQVGQRVRIFKGPLTGVEGILLERKGSHRIVVSVELLQRSVSAEIDHTWVRPESKSSQWMAFGAPAAASAPK